MPIKNNREYREFRSFELRAAEDRAEEKGGGIVEGYAATFDEFVLYEFNGPDYKEVYTEELAPDAFNDADMSDVVFLRDHEGQVKARTKNGLIELSVDDKGLFTKTDLTKTAGAREMFEDIQAGNYTQMSFAFNVRSSEWTEVDERETEGVIYYKRKITAIGKVFDISAVAFPANPATDISPATRAAFDGAIEELKAERLKAEARRNEEARKAAEIKLKIMEALKNDD